MAFGAGFGFAGPEQPTLPYLQALECPQECYAALDGRSDVHLEGCSASFLVQHCLRVAAAEKIYYWCTIVEAAARPCGAGSSVRRTNWMEVSHETLEGLPFLFGDSRTGTARQLVN